jgi:hypothetical protein
MTPMLITLEGDYTTQNDGAFDDLLGFDFMDDVLNPIGNFIVAPITGTTHAVMEAGRGISQGDMSRVLMAPVKGVGHTGMEMYRGAETTAELFWRPSKMSVWMQPVGTVLLAAGSVPSPLTPFLLGAGAGLNVLGAVGSGIRAKDLSEEAQKDADQNAMARAEKMKETNKKWLIGGAVLLTVGLGVLTLK